ncbi:MAG: hypothetical protein ACOX6Q_01265 [Candidatus Dojkabacteria bacterium]
MKKIAALFVTTFLFFTLLSQVSLAYPCNCREESYSCHCRQECYEACWDYNCHWGNRRCCGGYYWEAGTGIYICTDYCEDYICDRHCEDRCNTVCSTCKRTVCDECCDPVCTHTSCSTTAPSGYGPENPNNLCTSDTKTVTCTYPDSCDEGTCSKTDTYYRLETNTSPVIPSSTGVLEIDGVVYSNLSTNPNNPTIVKKPSLDMSSTYTLPAFSTPPGSRAVNTYTIPSTFPKSIFTEGEVRNIREVFQTLNRCDDTWLTTTRDVYYKTNKTPSIVVGPIDEGGNTPLGYDPNCEMLPDQECTIASMISNYGGEDSRTKVGSSEEGGCRSLTYTGTQVNNPLKVTLYAKDDDDNSQLRGAVIWLSKGNVPTGIVDITSTYTHTTNDEIGIMILSQGSTSKVYAITHEGKFASLSDSKVRRSDGNVMIDITDVSTSYVDDLVKYSATLTFIENSTNNPVGTYGFNAKIIDTFMLSEDNWVDMTDVTRYFNWNIDLVKPNVDSFKHTIKDMQTMDVTWNLSDAQTNIKEYVINAYRSELSVINTSITIANNPNSITLNAGTPPEAEIGNPRNPNQWDYLNINTTPVIDNSDVGISSNEGGAIDMYITAFDQACNYTTSSNNSVNLDPWISTKGGTLYSKGNILTNAKDLSSVDDYYYNIGGIQTITNALKSELKIGSEIISSSSNFIRNIIEANKTSARATNVIDTNNRPEQYYDTLKKNLSKKQEGVVEITDINACSVGSKCIMYSSEDIVIPSDYVCDKTILFMTEGNILINPNVTSDKVGLNGCMFVARENIEILQGEYRSANVVGYDYIEGYLYAGNQILVPFVDGDKLIRDGVEIYGGVIGVGKDLSGTDGNSAISHHRDLRLYNDINPSLVIAYDIKYTKISEVFFGKEASVFKREVGYKP